MEKSLKLFGTAAFMLSVTFADAAPIWVVQTANNLRRAARVAIAAKTGAQSAVVLGKCSNALPDDEIARLADIASRKGGVQEVGNILGKMELPLKYGEKTGHLILQDTYLRIAVQNGHLSKEVAANALKHLNGTPGLTSLLRKINSVSPSQVKGHLRELEIALHARQRGFQTVSLGQKFADGVKGSDTDLDVLLCRNGKNFAIESKAYSGTIPDAMARADAQSLAAFCKKIKNTVPVFCFEKAPSKFTQAYLKRHNIQFIHGTPQELAAKLDIIASIN